MSFLINLQNDGPGVLATSPDFPELTTFGDDRQEALARSVSTLEEAIAARMHGNQDVPVPSAGDAREALPTLTAVKVNLYQGMLEQGIGKVELARRLGWHLPQVDRALDVGHPSRLDWTDRALGAIGKRLIVQTQEIAE